MDKKYNNKVSRHLKNESMDSAFLKDKQVKKVKRQSFERTPYSKAHIEQFFRNKNMDFMLIDQLVQQKERSECPNCKQKVLYYCLKCWTMSDKVKKVERIKLPVQLNIAYFKGEKMNKSTALPLKMLIQPSDCNVIYFPFEQQVIDDLDNESTYILFPHPEARSLLEIGQEELRTIEKVVVVDCTWPQTKKILKEIGNKCKKVKYIKLDNYESIFWRFNQHSKQCLSTAEAVYYLYKEYMEHCASGIECNVDHLLFYFYLQYQNIFLKKPHIE